MPTDRQFFREMTLRICGDLDIDRALADAFAYLRQHMPVDAMGLGFSDLPAEKIRVLAHVTRSGARTLWADGAPEIALSDAMLDYVRAKPIDDPAALIVHRPGEHPPPLLDAFPELASSSALFLRLDVRGEEVGALLISAAGQNRYTEEHARLLDTIREPFAIAMLNARRFREIEAMHAVLTEDNRALSADMQRSVGVDVVGADFGLRDVMTMVRQVSPSTSPTLLLGETGTGKEVIANAIHKASPRADGPLISMPCGAVPETLLDSELFGHEKGAFTGAATRKRGRFERAEGGTLFLDEIGELSLDAQVKLLRVLQERRFERVGGTATLVADVRIIAATHRDLESMVREGRFREDLWYRLSVLPIRIPPLRHRREDVPSLVLYFIERKAREMNLQHVPRVAPDDLDRLRGYDWPGNVRELENVVERALILSTGSRLTFPPLGSPPSEQAGPERPVTSLDPNRTLDQAVEAHLRAVLERVGWRIGGPNGAAARLAMNPSTLRFRMKKLGIHRPGSRQVD